MDAPSKLARAGWDSPVLFTTGRAVQQCRTQIRSLIEDVRDSLAELLVSRAVRVDIDVPAELAVLVDGALLRRAVHHLVLNAIEAMPDGGDVVVTSHIGSRGFELEVADSGPGLSEEVARRVFEPRFTTKARAAGLGLADVRHIAELHGGDVTAINCPEGGAAFTIRIPQRALTAAA